MEVRRSGRWLYSRLPIKTFRTIVGGYLQQIYLSIVRREVAEYLTERKAFDIDYISILGIGAVIDATQQAYLFRKRKIHYMPAKLRVDGKFLLALRKTEIAG